MTPDQQPITKQDLREALEAFGRTFDTRLDDVAQSLGARIDAAVEAFAHNLSDLRGELLAQFERLQNRTERIEINVSSLLMQTAGMSKSLTTLERSDG